MNLGDLVRFKPEDWGTPLEDRPLGIVLSEPYRISARWRDDWGDTNAAMLVDIQFPGSSEVYSTGPETLEVVSEYR